MVRCRAKADAEYLAEKTGAKIVRSNGLADYEFRVTITRAKYAAFMVGEIMDVDYDNFKDSVKKRQGSARADVYMRVWSALLSLQPIAPYANVPKTPFLQPVLPGPRGGRQKNWWDGDSIVYDEVVDSVTDDPEFWNCRDCNKDISDCVCNPATRQARTSSGRKRGKKKKGKGVHAR